MNRTKQTDTLTTDTASGIGMSSDDMSMLNQVLQQVKGISCVSHPTTFDVAEQLAE